MTFGDAERTQSESDPHTGESVRSPENNSGVHNLCTRIAAALYNASDEYTRKFMVRPDCPGASGVEGDLKPICYQLADAVIRELKLDQPVDFTSVAWGIPSFDNGTADE